MPSVLRSALVFAFASCLVVLAAPGCSEQTEGQRCDFTKAGNSDCKSGLSCVRKGDLLEEITDLCCPPEGQESTERCTRKPKGGSNTAGTSNGGSGGSSGSTSSGGAGEAAGGAGEAASGTAGSGGDVGQAGEASLGGMTSTEGGAGAAGAPVSSAGAPVSSAGQGGAP